MPLRIKYLSVNKREAKYGDYIKPQCSIINENPEGKKISLFIELKRSGIKISEEEYKLKIGSGESKVIRLSRIELDKERFQKGKYILRVTIRENRHDADTKSTSFYLEVKREPAKRGFIKKIDSFQDESPIRYSVKGLGEIKVNLGHKDFVNIYEYFKLKPNVLNQQAGFYIIKICLDEAINELFKMKLRDNQNPDIDDLIQELQQVKDNMYYDVYE